MQIVNDDELKEEVGRSRRRGMGREGKERKEEDWVGGFYMRRTERNTKEEEEFRKNDGGRNDIKME